MLEREVGKKRKGVGRRKVEEERRAGRGEDGREEVFWHSSPS